MPLNAEDIERALERYHREIDRYEKVALFVADVCRSLVRDNAIRATVQFRVKDPERLRGKLQRLASLTSIDNVFSSIKDFAGVRVATYEESDRERVVSELQARFVGSGGGAIEVEVRDYPFPSFYRATHCQVVLTEDDLVGRFENLSATSCEVQVCSMLAHVWNELEHDLSYKPITGTLSNEELAALVNLGHLVRSGDGLIHGLLGYTDARLQQTQGSFADQWDFVARTRNLLPESTEFGTHSRQLYEELMALGIDSPSAIEEQLLAGYRTKRPYVAAMELITAIVNTWRPLETM
ncbi:MAG TPA: RelA/SpoT domain-containing protein [Acidimicrobiales bacterium]|nr:RelA/SpoT domain-containing protein [Acidimicrobiales bacterium]